MMAQRKLARITTSSRQRGGLGDDHLAAKLIGWEDFAANDPFLFLMDDEFRVGADGRVGSPHPHGGLETVTLVLEGSLCEIAEDVILDAGEVQWMTAGRGIVHGEHTEVRDTTRLLQLWLTLPKADRWAAPACQNIQAGAVAVRNEPGAEVRLYSGSSGFQRSPTRNFVPVTILEIRLDAGASFEQELPASYNGFLYVVEGAVSVGSDDGQLGEGQIGWLDRPHPEGATSVRMEAGPDGARLVLYAGEPQGDPIIVSPTAMRGFSAIADNEEDLGQMLKNYRAGRFELMSDVAQAERAL